MIVYGITCFSRACHLLTRCLPCRVLPSSFPVELSSSHIASLLRCGSRLRCGSVALPVAPQLQFDPLMSRANAQPWSMHISVQIESDHCKACIPAVLVLYLCNLMLLEFYEHHRGFNFGHSR
jgi:hypothetical protein